MLWVYHTFIMWGLLLLCLFLESFFFLIINKCWILSKAFSASIEMIVWFLFFNLYHIDWFAYIGKSLHPWNKNHLIMMYDLFNVLLGSVCYNFVEDFCIYVHQWCWPIIFFFCGIFIWFWYQDNRGLTEWVFLPLQFSERVWAGQV